ncbi:MAG: rhodanese-like domain-containing protein [Magnetospirillum sp.]|nr:rhodanese-like domain-containing protein [Magnetospirillum sp.]
MKRASALRLILLAFGLICLMAGRPAMADSAETPPTLEGVPVVTAEQVQKMQSAGAAIIDARVALEYAESHIKGAISVPYHEQSAKSANFNAAEDMFNVKRLPADKATPMVMYCNGPTCWKSYKAAVVAVKAGYTKVYWFRGGVPDWEAAKLPMEE